MKQPRGLFIGLTTLDLIYHTSTPPKANEKVVAQSMLLAAGGPATNAAIAFAALGGQATLVSAVGEHPLAHPIHMDLAQHHVHHLELTPKRTAAPTVSSVSVSTQTGDRAVISKNAQGSQVSNLTPIMDQLVPLLETTDVILLDGHQMALSQAIALRAEEWEIQTVFDGGSWKTGSAPLLPHLTHIICSNAFRPPGCGNESETLSYLRRINPQAYLAITHGQEPILLDTPTYRKDCPCLHIRAVDTLGAGDFFHGAFAFGITQLSFEASIQAASAIASLSCQFLGTREWLGKISQDHYPF